MGNKIMGLLIGSLLIITSIPAIGTMDNNTYDVSIIREIIDPEPDLYCEGGIIQNRVEPGSMISGCFTVENIGEPGSLLDWEVVGWPDFGEFWTISPLKGEDLTPEDDQIIVTVRFMTPNETETYFGGVIKVCAIDNPEDCHMIAINIAISKNREIPSPSLDLVELDPYIVGSLRLFGVNRVGVMVANTGDAIAHDVQYEFTITGVSDVSIHLSDTRDFGDIPGVHNGKTTAKVYSYQRAIYGFGVLSLHLIVTASNVASILRTVTGFQLGYFTLVLGS